MTLHPLQVSQNVSFHVEIFYILAPKSEEVDCVAQCDSFVRNIVDYIISFVSTIKAVQYQKV